MGSLLSSGLDAITIFLCGFPTLPILHPQTITIKYSAALEEILPFVWEGFHLPLSPHPSIMSNTTLSWWRSSFRADRGEISTPTLPVTLDLPPPGLPHKYEHGAGRGHAERARRRERDRDRKGQRQIPHGAEDLLLSVELQEYKLYTARPRWQEASRQSMRFDEKQFEQRMKWQELLIWLMACCPHAPTPSRRRDEFVCFVSRHEKVSMQL